MRFVLLLLLGVGGGGGGVEEEIHWHVLILEKISRFYQFTSDFNPLNIPATIYIQFANEFTAQKTRPQNWSKQPKQV
jgi:hypothetical protein